MNTKSRGWSTSRHGISVLCHRLLGKLHQTQLLPCVMSSKICFVGFSIQIERAAVAEFVVLFTHCQAAQLSEHCQPSQRMHTRIKNCILFGPNKSKSLFHLAHMHVCVST